MLTGWFLSGFAAAAEPGDCVVLLHGLTRTAASLQDMNDAFAEAGYTAVSVDYPSRYLTVEELARPAIEAGIERCPADVPVHFVTHSMGGILVRYYLEHHEMGRLGRVVMLGPPNQGSEVVDRLRGMPGFDQFMGPAAAQLGTGPDSIPSQLGPVTFDLGVIAGTYSIDPVSSVMLPNPDDGKVSVERTKVEGMNDFITVRHTHAFLMQAPLVIRQAMTFVATGQFQRETS